MPPLQGIPRIWASRCRRSVLLHLHRGRYNYPHNNGSYTSGRRVGRVYSQSPRPITLPKAFPGGSGVNDTSQPSASPISARTWHPRLPGRSWTRSDRAGRRALCARARVVFGSNTYRTRVADIADSNIKRCAHGVRTITTNLLPGIWERSKGHRQWECQLGGEERLWQLSRLAGIAQGIGI